MLVVQILLAFALFTGLLFLADRWATKCTTEDPIVLAEKRAARLAHRRSARSTRRRVRRARVRRPPAQLAEAPARRPIQVVAADLRRINRQVALVPSGSTLVRWKALWAAYDGVLSEAAEMLEVPQEIADQPAGIARDVERVRVLAALEAAGLVVRG